MSGPAEHRFELSGVASAGPVTLATDGCHLTLPTEGCEPGSCDIDQCRQADP